MTDLHIPVIDWTVLRHKDGTAVIVPTEYAKAIRYLRFLNDFRIRRDLIGVLYERTPNV